jgi:cation-transporting ATPase 13A1
LTREELNARQKKHFEQWNKEKLAMMEDRALPELGDACIAAPFTYKYQSIGCVKKLIKQGRTTLCTTMQMYKILALNSLISAYGMSALYFDGVKMGDS